MGVDAPAMEDSAPNMIASRFVTRFSLVLLLFSCQQRPEPALSQAQRADVTLYGVKVRHFEGESVTLAGTASKLSYFKEMAFFEAENGRFAFPQQPGVMADVELAAPSFQWGVKENTLSGSQGIHGLRSGFELKAQSFRLNLKSKAYQFEGDVQTKVERSK
jgi:hypothetical protein